MSYIQNKNGRSILLAMVNAIQDNKQYLSDIDGMIGDGDHGANMNKGFTMFGEALGEVDWGFTDGLFELGSILFNKIGGSMGPIYGTFFMDMADRGDGAEKIDFALFVDMLEAGLMGLYDIVEARPGDKTLIDTLYPAITALKSAQKAGNDFHEALSEMKVAAVAGKESTKELVAQYGRSARLGDRSLGILDAGATSCCIILCAMADGIIEVMEV